MRKGKNKISLTPCKPLNWAKRRPSAKGGEGGKSSRAQQQQNKKIVIETRAEQRRGSSSEKRGREGVGGVTPTRTWQREGGGVPAGERIAPKKEKKSAEKVGGLKS